LSGGVCILLGCPGTHWSRRDPCTRTVNTRRASPPPGPLLSRHDIETPRRALIQRREETDLACYRVVRRARQVGQIVSVTGGGDSRRSGRHSSPRCTLRHHEHLRVSSAFRRSFNVSAGTRRCESGFRSGSSPCASERGTASSLRGCLQWRTSCVWWRRSSMKLASSQNAATIATPTRTPKRRFRIDVIPRLSSAATTESFSRDRGLPACETDRADPALRGM
jgi:hypothetical protein